MSQLIQSIVSYLFYLEHHCGMSVSIHLGEDSFYSLPEKIIFELMRYFSHKNPYCMIVKKQYHTRCLQTQKDIKSSCACQSGFCHRCHAGVRQYIYPLTHNCGVIGFIAICGFRFPEDTAPIIDADMWKAYLSPSEPPNAIYESVLPPLAIMIDKLFDTYATHKSDEYSQILHYLNEYHTNITLDDLCNRFNRSKSHISHLFKSRNGSSIREYCNKLKLEDAKHLLQMSTRSVTEIALDAGFNDVSYFIMLFKRKYGLSPYKFRMNQIEEA